VIRRLVLLVLLAGCGCNRQHPQSFQHLWEEARGRLHAGEVEAACGLAREGRRRARVAANDSWVRAFSVLEAEGLVTQRRTTLALALLDQAMIDRAPADGTTVRALMTRGLARCLSRSTSQEDAASQKDMADAARIALRLHSAELSGEVSLRLGTCLGLEGKTAAAGASFRRALSVATQQHLPLLEAQACGSLGLLATRSGRFDEAADWLQRSIRIATAAKADGVVAKSRMNLGWCFYRLGDYERAIGLLKRVVGDARDRNLSGDLLRALTILGNSQFRSGRASEAVQSYDAASQLAAELGSLADVAVLLANRASVELGLGHEDSAERAVEEGLRMNATARDEPTRLYLLQARGVVWERRGVSSKAEAAWKEVVGSEDAPPDALMDSWGSLARLYCDAGRIREAERAYGEAFKVASRAEEMLYRDETQITFFASLRRLYDNYIGFLVERGRRNDALTTASLSSARVLRERLSPQEPRTKVPLPEQRLMPQSLDAVALVYWLAPSRSFVWVITRQGVTLRSLPDVGTIRRDIEAHQSLLLQSRDLVAQASSAGDALWRDLLAPVADLIPKGSRVVVVPDGPTQTINLETLVVPGTRRHYWIEDVAIERAPALDLLGPGLPRPSRTTRALLIGDPVPASEDFPLLPFAETELAQIERLFAPVNRTVRRGAEATPIAYGAAEPADFDFVHFAAHAIANRESPLDSAIVLSPENDSYKLYARDIMKIPLHAELVTLSACHSAGSRAYAGEGLVGLAWAFLSAGASNVIGGLWNVEDASTAELMEELYRGLNKGMDPASALRAAKLKLLHSNTAYRKPYYWAPFVLYTRDGSPPRAARVAQSGNR
jgi:CHAT domain-containing protein